MTPMRIFDRDGPGLILKNGKVFLAGAELTALELWDLEDRLQKAKKNVQEALKLPDSSHPIFVGMEHLPVLLDKKFNKECLVIEKSSLYAELLRDKKNIPLTPPDNIHLITGEWGVLAPGHFKVFHKIFYSQELGLIAYKIFALPDDFFTDNILYELPAQHDNPDLVHLLSQMTGLVVRAKEFHRANAELYKKIRQQAAQHRHLLLSNNRQNSGWLINNFKALMAEPDLRMLKIQNRDTCPGYQQQMSQFIINQDEIPPYLDQARDFLAELGREKPAVMVMENRGAFVNPEDVFIYEEMLHRCGIPLWSVWYDWITQQTVYTSMGGWSTPLHTEGILHNPDSHFVTLIDQISFARTSSRYPVKICPYNYPEAKNCIPPLEHPEDMERDVAIIHHPRLVSILYNEVNEIYEMVRFFSGHEEYGKSLFNFLAFLRKYLQKQEDPLLNALSWRSLINYIDFLYYNQIRVRQVLNFASAKNPFKISLYGSEWEKIAPPEICAGHINSQEDLRRIFRSSLVTVDFTQMHSQSTTHFPVVECLASGGLPLILKPFHAASPDDPRATLFAKNLFAFESTEQLSAMVTHFKNNFADRQSYIKGSQNGWLKKIWHENSLVEVLAGKLDLPAEPTELPLTFSHSQESDNFILKAALGYLFSFCGYAQTAVQIWDKVLRQNLVAPYLPLVTRLIKTAIEIRDTGTEKYWHKVACSCGVNDREMEELKWRMPGQ